MKSTVTLALWPEYHGQPTIPEGAQLWTVIINPINHGHAYNFTASESKSVSYPNFKHSGLRCVFNCKSLGSYTNSIDIDGHVTFIANSLCVALRRFMLYESYGMQGASLPVHIAIKFSDGPLVSFDTSLVVEKESIGFFLRPGPSPTPLHRFIDLASFFVEIGPPYPSEVEPADQTTALAQVATKTQCVNVAPIDNGAYRAAPPWSPLFDSCPGVHWSQRERRNAIVRVILHGKRLHGGVSKTLVIGDAGSADIVSTLREHKVEVLFQKCRENTSSGSDDEETFHYSNTGRYTFDNEKFDVVFIDTPSNGDLAVDTRQKCELATAFRDVGKVNESIIVSVSSMPTIVGTYDILDIPSRSATDTEAILRLRNTPGRILNDDDPLHCVILSTFEILVNGEGTVGKFHLPNHPIYSNFFPTFPDEPGVFICKQHEWNHVLLGRSYLVTASQPPLLRHIGGATNPLECYAALKSGTPFPLSTSLEETFSPPVNNIRILSSTFFSHNPRFLKMVAARYDELLEICNTSGIDAPEEVISVFSSPATAVLLNNFSEFRSSLYEEDEDNEKYYATDYDRVLPFEAMAIICSIQFFCIIRMYLYAHNDILEYENDAWDLQELLWRLTAFGTWEEKRWYMVLKFQKLFDGKH
ncbi:hypothetical protein NHQ30_008225 [Ciborinia camelliae]|nr:hypothetical protein NHQ30_008225 [Ciborinia camelliae]